VSTGTPFSVLESPKKARSTRNLVEADVLVSTIDVPSGKLNPEKGFVVVEAAVLRCA
jgi:hypothetical protein